MPFAAHLAQLRYTLERLHELPCTPNTAAHKKSLRELLTVTIKTLHELYPDGLSYQQRYRFVYNLQELERRFLALTPGSSVPIELWPDVHQTLQITIEAALTDLGNAHRKALFS